MPTHAEQRLMPYSPEEIFDLVADVDRYHEFLPWCRASRVTRRDGDIVYADLVIGFGIVRERLSSRVTLKRPEAIDVAYLKGPMRYLDNHWRFEARRGGACLVDFHIDFEFRSALMQRLIGVLFNEAVRRMIGAFEARARAVYGPRGQG